MKFEEALAELRKGRLISIDGVEFFHLRQNFSIEFYPHWFDSDRWEVIEEPGKTFDQVFEAFKEGKTIRRKSNHPSQLWNKQICFLYPDDLLANDWEVIE